MNNHPGPGAFLNKSIEINISEKQAFLILWLFIGLYVFVFSLVSFLKFNAFVYNDFDLAVHSQVLWNLTHGSLYSSILGIGFLGNHAHLISFLIAPIYKLFPHPLTLLFLQTLALGMGAYPLYLLSRSVLGYAWALVIATMYLIYPALGYTNLFEFHPTAFATFFLFFMLYEFYRGRLWPFIIFMTLSMICQENIPLVVIMVGFYALIRRKGLLWVIIPVLAGGFYFWLAIAKIMPAFNKNTIQFISIYGYLGRSYSEIIVNILKHPLLVLRFMFIFSRIVYLIQLFMPLAFIPLLSPGTLLIALPFFMQHLLSLRPTEMTVHYHYTAEMIPFIFFSFIFGVNNLLRFAKVKKQQALLGIFLLLFCAVANFYLGPHCRLFTQQARAQLTKDDRDRTKESFLKKIPPDAAVVATFEFLPHLTHRKELYSFHHLYMGYYTLSSQPYRLPQTVQYALLDFNDWMTFSVFHNPQGYQAIRTFLDSGPWGVVDVRDSIVLLQKGIRDRLSLYQILTQEPKPQHRMSWSIAGDVELLGYDVQEGAGHMQDIVFYWRCLNKTDKDINVFFELIDSEGKMVYHNLEPVCYRIHPTGAWQPGEWIREERYFSIPSQLKPGRYSLVMGFFDFVTGEIYLVDPKDPLGRISLFEISVDNSLKKGR